MAFALKPIRSCPPRAEFCGLAMVTGFNASEGRTLIEYETWCELNVVGYRLMFPTATNLLDHLKYGDELTRLRYRFWEATGWVQIPASGESLA